jgi:dynein heavy chain
MENCEDTQGGSFKETASKPLNDLIYMITHIYKPLEKNDGFKKNLEKLEVNIKNSLEQVENKYSLGTNLDLPVNQSDEEIAKNPQWVKKLDKLVEDWINNIDKTINSLSAPKSDIKSASMEIDNRRRIVSNLSMLDQLLNSESVKRITNIIGLSDSSTKKEIFEQKKSHFQKTYDDAVDYLKFLTTLERSIKDLSSDDLPTIQHCIPGIFHNLKIIFLISKHKDPNKFGFLMEVMAREICEKISDRIKPKEIFKKPEESIKVIDQAIDVAETWKKCYNDTKSKAKWSYQINSITGGTDYIAKMCRKLKEGLTNINDFLRFLGPGLKRVIGGNSEKIDRQRESVFKAYEEIETVNFSIFDKKNEENCKTIFNGFQDKIRELEKDTIELIDQTFVNLRSAESAYDLYTNFEDLIKQANIKDAMNKKYINILEQFRKEITNYSAIFDKYNESPPISKAKSEIAGKVSWARLLYLKMKRPIYKIFSNQNKKAMPVNTHSTANNFNNEKSEQEISEENLKKSFLEIAKRLKSYEMKIFENWKSHCIENFKNYLQKNILRE